MALTWFLLSSSAIAAGLLAAVFAAMAMLVLISAASAHTYRAWRWGIGLAVNYPAAGPYEGLSENDMHGIWASLSGSNLPGRPERAWTNLRSGTVVIECSAEGSQSFWVITRFPTSPWPDWVAGVFVSLGDRTAVSAGGVARVAVWARLQPRSRPLEMTSVRDVWSSIGGSADNLPTAAARADDGSAVTFGLRDANGNPFFVYRGPPLRLGTARLIGLCLVHYRDTQLTSAPAAA